MKGKIMKRVGIIVMAFSILNLLGCNTINEKTAELVVKELNEKYEEEFEVVALGKRFGTKNNDTVTVYVKDKAGVVFTTIMNTKGNITSEDYIYQKIGKETATILTKSLKEVGVEAEAKLSIVGGTRIENKTKYVNVKDYISSHSPDYFIGDIIFKEDEVITNENLITAYESAFRDLNKTAVKTYVWVISSDDFEKAVSEFNLNPDVSEAWFDDYNVVDKYYLDISHEGVKKDNENIKKEN